MSVNAVQTRSFSFTSMTLRVVDRGGEPWFVAADAIDILNLDRKALERLDEDEKGVSSIHTLGGQQNARIINESGLYSLILGSRKPEAARFKKWVTSEVLPAIRRTGAYVYEGGEIENSFVKLDFDGVAVRSMRVDGEDWYSAMDVCAAIGITNVTRLIWRLPLDQRKYLCGNRDGRRLICINKSAISRIASNNTKCEARRFQAWAAGGSLKLPPPPVTIGEKWRMLEDESDFQKQNNAQRQHLAKLIEEARVAKTLIREIEACKATGVKETGEPDLLSVAAIIESAILNTQSLHGLALGLADYICLAMDGATTDAQEWDMLVNLRGLSTT